MPNDIISRVQKLPHAKSVLITGGPGAGKTTLAASLLGAAEQDVCWQIGKDATMPNLGIPMYPRAMIGDLKRQPGSMVLTERVAKIRVPETPVGLAFETLQYADGSSFCPATVVLDDIELDFDSVRAMLAFKSLQIIVCGRGAGRTPEARELEALFDVSLHVYVDYYSHVRKVAAERARMGPLGSDSYDLVEGRGFVLRQ